MDSLLQELKNLDYTAAVVAKRKEEQRKQWLNSRRDDCPQQGNNKRRRFNPRVDVDNSSPVYCSEQEEVAKKPEHLPSVEFEQSDKLSNT